MHIIEQTLRDLDCAVSYFVEICGLIGRTRLTQGLKQNDLDRNLEAKLITILDGMAELKRALSVSPNWADAENIRTQLEQRRKFLIAAKYDETRVAELLLESKDGAANGTQGTITALDKASA